MWIVILAATLWFTSENEFPFYVYIVEVNFN